MIKPCPETNRFTCKNIARLFFTLAIVIALAACEKEEFDPVKGFEAAVKQRIAETEKATIVSQNKTNKKWRKTKPHIFKVKYDVKNNDSLVNPYKGIVSFIYLVDETAEEPSEAAAEASPMMPGNWEGFTASLTYIGSEKGWTLVDGAYYFNHEPDYTYPLSSSRISTIGGPPFAQLLDWLFLVPVQ
jgi:hypothetical protein